MNIFFLDVNLQKSAEYHVDKHVTKMRIELAQLACAAHHLTGTSSDMIPYKLTHKNHPSSIWTRESLSNYNYIVNLGFALCEEMIHRHKTKYQKCIAVFEWLRDNQPNIQDIGFTKPRLAMDFNLYGFTEIIQTTESDLQWAVNNYREYYRHGKVKLYSWKKRDKPEWISIN